MLQLNRKCGTLTTPETFSYPLFPSVINKYTLRVQAILLDQIMYKWSLLVVRSYIFKKEIDNNMHELHNNTITLFFPLNTYKRCKKMHAYSPPVKTNLYTILFELWCPFIVEWAIAKPPLEAEGFFSCLSFWRLLADVHGMTGVGKARKSPSVPLHRLPSQ